MPAFSGLWDGMHGQAYSAMPKADANPPQARGIVRTFMQRQSMHGHVNALGRNAPATVAQVAADRGDIVMNGGYDYANRQQDAGNQVTVENMGTSVHGAGGTALASRARPSNPDAAALAHTYDTTKTTGYVEDAADTGATGEAVAEVVGV